MKKRVWSNLAIVVVQGILCADALAIRYNPPLQTAPAAKISTLI